MRGNLDPATGKRIRSIEETNRRIESRLATQTKAEPPRNGNTTLSLLVTNQKLDARSLSQLANQVHSSLARVIEPFHTMHDGDVLFAVTTGEVESDLLREDELGLIASDLAWDAVLSSVQDQ